MASGPCGVEFREAFSCFHYSAAEPKGSDCYGAFVTMQSCMSQFPEIYPPAKSEDTTEELASLSELNDTGSPEISISESKEEMSAQAGASSS